MSVSSRRIPPLAPSVLRDPDEHERASTPLELLFDLCFVVAVAALAAELHHGVTAGHAPAASAAYALLFVPVWWAWMSYTWFATAFSHDDPVTRLLTLGQMAGVLAVAATVPTAAEGDLVPFALAYAAMRLPLVLQWLRAARDDPPHRGFALTYAAGSLLAQALWVGSALAGGPVRAVGFVVALGVELATPALAVRRTPDRVFHPGHIAERYGLFTLIVLGETILAVTVGLTDALGDPGRRLSAFVVGGCALVIAFGMWWTYFDALGRDALTRHRRAAFTWGYGHYALYAALAAIGAGVQVQLDLLGGGHGAGGDVGQGLAVLAAALPVALSLAAIAWLQQAANGRTRDARLLAAAAASCALVGLAGPVLPVPVADAILSVIVVGAVLAQMRASES